MKRLIIDTDIGGDCDDAGALLTAKTAHLNGDVTLAAVTSCTTLAGAAQCIAGILADYGLDVPVGVNTGAAFMEGGDFDRYASAVAVRFPRTVRTQDSVGLLKKTLSAGGVYTLAAIGPQRNIAALLDGEYLSAAEEVVIMGGTLADPPKMFEGKRISVEWNIIQDVSAAAEFAARCTAPITYVPFELGYDILTGSAIPAGTVARYAYDVRGENGVRPSWDPCAVYYAIYGPDDLFELSPPGRMRFEPDGKSVFTEGRGPHRVLLQKASSARIAARLNEFMH